MKRMKIASVMMAILLPFYLLYNAYFGWNLEPISKAERYCDWIANYGMLVATIFYFLPIVDVYRHYIEKNKID